MAFKAKSIKVKNLKKEQPNLVQIDVSGDFIRWGEMENFPLFLVNTINRSLMGKACYNLFNRYVVGNGFNDKNIAIRYDSMLRYISKQLVMFGGFGVKMWFNPLSELVKAEPIPYEYCRLGVPNEANEVTHIVYNSNFGNSYYLVSDNVDYPIYDFTKESILRGFELYPNKPFVYWFGIESEFSRYYPTPFFWGDINSQGGGYEAMLGDYLLSKLLTKELSSGFLQNVILKMVGEPDAPLTQIDADLAGQNKQYTTIDEHLTEKLQDMSGIDGDSMLVLWSKVKEHFPELQEFPARFNYEKLKDVHEVVKSNVATAFGVPSILVNIQTSGTLSKDDIRTASQLMYGVVRPFQMIIEAFFTKLAEKQGIVGEVSIENYNPYPESKTVDNLIWESLTLSERRNWIKKNTDIELIEIEQ